MLGTYIKIVLLQGMAAFVSVVALCLVSFNVKASVYGQYSLYISVVLTMSAFFVNWPNAALLRYGREEWTQRKTIGATLASRAILYFIGILCATLVIFIFEKRIVDFLKVDLSFIKWVIFGVILVPLVEMGIYLNQAMGNSLVYGYVPLLSRSFFMIAVISLPFVSGYRSLEYLALFYLSGALLAVMVMGCAVPKKNIDNFKPDRDILRKIILYSWAIPIGSITAYLVQWIDIWVIRIFGTAENVGLYSWAYQLTSVGALIFAPLNVILTPLMIDAHVSGNDKRMERYSHVCLKSMLLAGVFFSFCLPAVQHALSIFCGNKYMTGYPIIMVLTSLLPLQLLSYLFYPLFAPHAKLVPRVLMISVYIAALNTAGDFFLVPRIGVMGAALSTAAAFGLGALLQVFLMKKALPKIIIPPVYLFILCGLVMPLSAFALLILGGFRGSFFCLVFNILILFLARYRGLFCAEEIRWLEDQEMNRCLKTALVRFARFFMSQDCGVRKKPC